MRIFSYSIGPLRLILLTATCAFLAYETYENWPKPPVPPPPRVLTPAERAQMESLTAPSVGARVAISEQEARKREQARQTGGITLTPDARRAAEQELADPLHSAPPTLAVGSKLPTAELQLNNDASAAK